MNAVNDLKELIRSLGISKFHILGHSFGGVLAYEYSKSTLNDIEPDKPTCLSLTLSNTPSNMAMSHAESSRIVKLIHEECMLDSGRAKDIPISRIINDKFQKRHECRTEHFPEPLVAAIQGRGVVFGPEDVRDYIAVPPAVSSPRSINQVDIPMPPVLLIRGEYDFVTEECIKGWRKIFTSNVTRGYREEVLKDCSHYCHLENSLEFCDLIKTHCFINDY